MDNGEREILSLIDGKEFSMNRFLHIAGFDEDSVILATENGRLHIGGDDLKVMDFSKETGKITIEGEVSEIIMERKKDKTKSAKGFFSH